MKILFKQLQFDGKRMMLRNSSYLFFTVIMPMVFYIIFTKISTGPSDQLKIFYKTYLGSMIIYSIVISAINGFADLIQSDRDEGLIDFLNLAPHGKIPYYCSVGFWSIVLNVCSTLILGLVAIIVNGVKLTLIQWICIAILPIVGLIPLLLLGFAMSNISRRETLGIVSNLVTFPMAIASGLWWPLNMMPSWIQTIGKLLPTYFANNILSQVMLEQKLKLSDFGGLGAWIIIGLTINIVVHRLIKEKSVLTSVS